MELKLETSQDEDLKLFIGSNFKRKMESVGSHNLKYICFLYCSLVVAIFVTMDMNQFVAKNPKNRQKYADIHNYAISGAMLLSICLFLQQILFHRKQVSNRNLEKFKSHHLIGRHIKVLLIVMSILSSVQYVWDITRVILMHVYHCSTQDPVKSTENTSTVFNCNNDSSEDDLDDTRHGIQSHLMFDVVKIVYVVVQTYWILGATYYHYVDTKVGFRLGFTLCQAAITNACLYFKLTFHEANVSFHMLKYKHQNMPLIICNTPTTTSTYITMTSFESFLYIARDYIEPLGYATTVESLILFVIIIVVLTYEKFFSYELPRTSHDSETTCDLSSPQRKFGVVRWRQKYPRLLIWVIFSHGCAVILGLLCFGLILADTAHFVRALISSDIGLRVGYSEPVYPRIFVCFSITLLCLLTLVNQNSHNGHAIESYHVKVDVLLLYGTVNAGIIHLLFTIQAAIDLDVASYPNRALIDEIRSLQTAEALTGLVQLLVQVIILQRAMNHVTDQSLMYNVKQQRGFNYDTKRIDWVVEVVCTVMLTAYNLDAWIVALYMRKYTLEYAISASEYYPDMFWIFLTETTYPLLIFYRFHSFVVGLTLTVSHLKGYRLARQKGLKIKYIFLPFEKFVL